MRFLLSRIFKNFPIIYKYWLSYLEYSDSKHYDKYCRNYKIIPVGNYCLPRVITTINRIKPPKKYGEETFPFDLCFSDFVSNTHFINSKFNGFFDDLEFDEKLNYYVNKKFNYIFNHDNEPLDDFKKRYNKRIDNLYNAVSDTSKHVFFLIATFDPIKNDEVKIFTETINKYRNSNTYGIIIINQSNQQIKYDLDNVYFIDLSDDKSFNIINKNNDWVSELKTMKLPEARIFNNKVASKISEIIKPYR